MAKWRTTPKRCKRVRNFLHCVINPKGKFDSRSFRAKILPRGRRLILGCPKGNWDNKKKRCRVGTRGQKILRPVK